MLMEDSLSGNAKTLMFVNISPSIKDRDDTIHSLDYAERVRCVTKDKEIVALRRENTSLKSEIAGLTK